MLFEDLRLKLTPGPMETHRNYCYFCMLAQRQAFCKNHEILGKTLDFLGFSEFHRFSRKMQF